MTTSRTKKGQNCLKAGDTRELHVDGMVVSVTIKDTRSLFGRDEVLVSPVSGSGEKWMTATKLKGAGHAAKS